MILTLASKNILVRVRNNVTTSASLPGNADSGIMKLIVDAVTIRMQGKKYL